MEKTLMVHMMDYFKSEYNSTKTFLEKRTSWANPQEVIYNAIQRCLGAAMFVQRLDETLSYDEIEQTYNFYKEQFEKILE